MNKAPVGKRLPILHPFLNTNRFIQLFTWLYLYTAWIPVCLSHNGFLGVPTNVLHSAHTLYEAIPPTSSNKAHKLPSTKWPIQLVHIIQTNIYFVRQGELGPKLDTSYDWHWHYYCRNKNNLSDLKAKNNYYGKNTKKWNPLILIGLSLSSNFQCLLLEYSIE